MPLLDSEKTTERKEKPLTKVVIRRLPPTMLQEEFLDQISPVPEHNYFYYVKGNDIGENSFSRAYINFIRQENVYIFKEKFDNYVFIDGKGHEYPAVVEFAPFQKIPKKRGKSRTDSKCNTIETDQVYLDFVENLNKPIEQEEKPEYTLKFSEKNEKKEDTTPLLEYIKNKRAHKLKMKEIRRDERIHKRKEFERKKDYSRYDSRYYDDNRYSDKSGSGKYHSYKTSKYYDSPLDTTITKETVDNKSNEKSSQLRTSEKKHEERKERKEIKLRFPKHNDYYDSRDYKYDDYRKDEKAAPRKVKKYSERREERKIEVQKAEQRKTEIEKNKIEIEQKPVNEQEHVEETEYIEEENQDIGKDGETKLEIIDEEANKRLSSSVQDQREIDDKTETVADKEDDEKVKLDKDGMIHDNQDEHNDNEQTKKIGSPQLRDEEVELKHEKRSKSLVDLDESKSDKNNSKRIRNKDRPSIPLYRPGMLSRRKQNDNDDNGKSDLKKE